MERRDQYRRSPRREPFRDRGSRPKEKKQFIKKTRDLVILDILWHGHPDEDRPTWAKNSIAQVLTFPDWVLYEVKANKSSNIQIQERNTYEQFLKDEKLKEVLKKIDYDYLTATSKSLIQSVIETEVIKYEKEFLEFFNKSASITPRMHALKLLPGIGNKHMWEILQQREKKLFESFQDIADRTSISNPAKQIALRIIKELQREEKYYIFSKTQKYE